MKVNKIMSIFLTICMLFGTIPFSFSASATEILETVDGEVSLEEFAKAKSLDDLVAGEDYVENEIIVCFKEQSDETGAMPEIFDDYDLSLDYCLSNASSDVSKSEDTATYLMTMSNMSTNIANLIEDLENNPDIVYAQPNYIYNTCEEINGNVNSVNSTKIKNYNNSQLSMFQSLSTDKTDEWWSSTGGEGVIIAVIDGGIDLDHPALSDCLWNENGVYGYNTTDPDNVTAITMSNCDDYANEHGTHVAGIIGMQSDDTGEYTCKGIAPGAKIIDLQATNDTAGSFETVSLIAAMEKAVELGADVVNLSLSGEYYDYAWNLVCNRAARSLIIVASAGNDGYSEAGLKNYPAAFSSIIGVMAYGGEENYIDDTDSATNFIANNYPFSGYQKIASFSNYDFDMRCYDIVAPGVNVCSANAGGTGNITGYSFKSGTSMASPVVAAAAALYLEENPSATPAQVRKALRTTVGRETISGKFKSIPNKLDIDKLLETNLDRTVDRSYANADEEGYSKLCELIKINLGYQATDEITITNDDLTLMSNLRIDSYESIGDSLDELDELSRLISLTVSGYDFNNTRINTLFNENQFEHLETLEICDTAVYKIDVNGQISSALSELNIHNNVNLSCLTNLDSVNISTFHLENNNISDLSFLKESNRRFSSLYLSGNKIKDLMPLTELTKISYLYLADNCVEDYTPILNINGLSFVDLSENYLSDSEDDIDELLNGDTEHPIFIYKPFKDDFVEIENVKLNDFSVKRTDVDYIPKVVVSPTNATYGNITSLTGNENDIVTVNRYTGQINYNPDYQFDSAADEFDTNITYSNDGLSGTAQLNLLMPVISELNYEKYTYDTGVTQNYITMLTTTDTTQVKVVQTYAENGGQKGTPVEKNVINDCEYVDYGDNRLITFSYDEAIASDSVATVYAGDSLGYFSSEVISNANTIEVSVVNSDIDSISGSSKLLNIIDDVNIIGIGSNAIGSECDIDNIYFSENIYALSENAFDGSSVENAVFYCLDEFEVAIDAFGACGDNFKVYTSYDDSELAEECDAADITCVTDYEFEENTLLKYNGRAASVELPECLNITTIGSSAFKNNRSLTSIDLGEEIYAINDSAFYGCSKLQNVTNLEKVKRIGNGAFRSTAIADIDITNAETIGSYAFGNCTNVENVNLIGDTSENAFILNDNVFYGCTNLKNIGYKGTLEVGSKVFGNCTALTEIFSEDVELTGTEAFSGCTSLEKLVLSENSNIPEKSFDGCSSLEKVKVKNTETLEIGDYAFRGTSSLEELGLLAEKIYFVTTSFVGSSDNLTVYCNAEAIKSARPDVSICTDFQTTIWNNKIILEEYLGNSENVVIPEGLEIYQIGAGSFFKNSTIVSVFIPNSVLEIGMAAFGYATNLSQIHNGKNVKKLDVWAFDECKKLRDIDSLTSLQEMISCCLSGSGIEHYTMPNNVLYCDNGVFMFCKDLVEVVFSKNLTYVGSNIFQGCTSLERCVLNDNIQKIESNAFKDCFALKQIYITDSVTKIDITSFELTTNLYSSNIAPIALETMKFTEDNVVKNNLNIGNSIYPNYKVTDGVLLEYQSETGYDYIDEEGNKVIDVPNVVEIIPANIFKLNRNVDKVIFSEYLDVIGERTFMDCSVKEIVMPKSMSSIGVSAFNRTNIGVMNIPTGLASIERFFLHNTHIKSVVIPDTVTEIREQAFGACYKLNSVYIPDSVTTISSSAFEGSSYPITFWGNENTFLSQYVSENSEQNGNNVFICKLGYDIVDNILNSYTGSDKNVQVPFGLGLTGIAEEAFKNNTTIESVVVSSGITNIGAECFSGCTSLTSIYVPDDVVSVGINAFDGIDNLTVYCNEGSYIEEYCIANNISVNTDFDISDGVLNAYSGSEVNVIIPADLCVLKIGAGAFDRNYTIKSIVVPESVHTIGSSFMHCIGLESVVLPATVTAIEALAFLGCINLKNINIPIGIKTISGFAFARCSSLESIDLSNVETILYNAFDGCTNLGNITLGASLTSIGVDAFKDCSNLVINCYSDTYAHLYAVDNEIPYVLLDETSTTTFSLRSSADVDVLENNITSESLEEYVNCNPEEELYEYIQAEYNGEITEDNVDDVLTYIVNNR